jgi:type IV pilus assembly protein PilE
MMKGSNHLDWGHDVQLQTRAYENRHARGFTLLELLMALGIAGILAGISLVSYQSYVARAKALEGETALGEVNRLETVYYQARSEYSASLKDIGYNPIPPLKYYDVSVLLIGKGGDMTYRAVATPKGSLTTDVLVLTKHADGSESFEKMPAIPLTVSSGNNSDPGNSLESTNPTSAGPQSSGSTSTTSSRSSSTTLDPTVTRGGKAGE